MYRLVEWRVRDAAINCNISSYAVTMSTFNYFLIQLNTRNTIDDTIPQATILISNG